MGRKPKYETEEERREAKRLQTKNSYEKMKGGDLKGSFNNFLKGVEKTANKGIKNIKNKIVNEVNAPIRNVKNAINTTTQVANQVGNKVNQTIQNVKDYANVVVNGRNDYQPKVRDILSKYGDKPIQKMSIIRAPVPSLLTGALSALSLGKFGENLSNSPYDTLFHLSLIMTIENKKIILEKNEVINMDVNPKITKDTQTKEVPIPIGLTLDTLLDNAKKSMGGKFFSYSARDNNCQDFILAILNSNNIGNEEDRNFVKQDTKSLFDNLPTLRKISNSITDLGAKVNHITAGAGIDPCWNGYEMRGMKMKNKKLVPNCIPEGEGINKIDFKDVDWGSLTKQFNSFKRKHPLIKSLEEFSHYIINNPNQFQSKTKKRAEFYVNVLNKKHKGQGLGLVYHHHHHHYYY